MKKLGKILAWLLLLAAATWFSVKVELGGQTLWERFLASFAGQAACAGMQPPMEDVTDEDRRHLDELIKQHSK